MGKCFLVRVATFLRCAVGLAALLWPVALEQAHGQFETILNVPPDPLPDLLAPSTQLNLVEGGVIPNRYDFGTPDTTTADLQVNIMGGSVGAYVDAWRGSQVTISGGLVGKSFRAQSGSQVTITGGSVGNRFNAIGGRVTISGGSVGRSSGARDGGAMTIRGGAVGDNFTITTGSRVTMIDGSIGDELYASGSEVTIIGGSIGSSFDVGRQGRITIRGGVIGDGLQLHDGSEVTIRGGTIGDDFRAYPGSSVNIVGTNFILYGRDITDRLTPGVPFTLDHRNVVLSGLLADGSPFDFLLGTNRFVFDYFDYDTTLTITLVPEPSSGVLCGLVALAACLRGVRGRRFA